MCGETDDVGGEGVGRVRVIWVGWSGTCTSGAGAGARAAKEAKPGLEGVRAFRTNAARQQSAEDDDDVPPPPPQVIGPTSE